MKNGNPKIQKAKKPKYSIKDFQTKKENFDAATRARIAATIAVLRAIDRQERHLKNDKN